MLFAGVLSLAIWVFAFIIFDDVHLPGSRTNVFLGSLDTSLHAGYFRQLSWLLIFVVLVGAFGSAMRARRRKMLLERQRDLQSLKNLTWQQFEQLVAEAYRRLGYSISINDQNGADGGIDLILKRSGEVVLVQCKRWKSSSVGVAIVREMYGLLTHHRADRVKIVCVGRFTKDARNFAHKKPIELVTGDELLELVLHVQSHRSGVQR